ncbi:hypothetical protein [Pseudomonas sp.]|uniref:hypothetical protein n=1 Tax=Pseudomonas sp. TaxID=306 RepID=UPI00272B8DD1|nr:hypothetical protein [Pseudomonas sp.]
MVLVSETYVRSLYSDKPRDNDTVQAFLHNLLGGFVGPVSALGLFVWGFAVYRWWVPLLALFGCSYVMGRMFEGLIWEHPLALVLSAFPLGLVFTVAVVLG